MIGEGVPKENPRDKTSLQERRGPLAGISHQQKKMIDIVVKTKEEKYSSDNEEEDKKGKTTIHNFHHKRI